MDKKFEELRALAEAAKGTWGRERDEFEGMATPTVVLELIALAERATEAKPSASAAPGIDTPEFRKMIKDRYFGVLSHEDFIAHIDAAIAAARKEAFEAGRLYEQEIVTQEAEEAADRAEAEAVKRAQACGIPPTGWHCTRAAGHSGPCAAHPAQPQAKAPQQPPAGKDVYDAERLYRMQSEPAAAIAALSKAPK